MSGEQRLGDAFVALADTLGPAFEVADLLGRLAETCVALLGGSASRVMLLDDDRHELAGYADQSTSVAALPPPDRAGGPGPEAYRSGRPVSCPDLDAAPAHWRGLAESARAAGLRGVYAWPLRHRDSVVGAVEVYRTGSMPYTEPEVHRGQVLATVATISILRERRQRRADELARQLQHALDSRLVIEQAKGILAERSKVGVDEAFTLLRGYARRHQSRLATVARQLIDGAIDAALVAPPGPAEVVPRVVKRPREHSRQRPQPGG
jgi:ANTAR domain/GAF domain